MAHAKRIHHATGGFGNSAATGGPGMDAVVVVVIIIVIIIVGSYCDFVIVFRIVGSIVIYKKSY